MRERIQFLVDPAAKDRYQRVALAEGRTLSEWLRRCADAAAGHDPERQALATRAGLESFFERCNDLVDRWTNGLPDR